MKVIIAGSRRIPTMNLMTQFDWEDKEIRKQMLLALNEAIVQSGFDVTEVVSGCAWGIDQLGETWARIKKIPIKQFKADWGKFNKAAGPIRNGQMAEYADALVCIMAEESSGSLNMVQHMKKLNKPTFVIIFGNTENIP